MNSSESCDNVSCLSLAQAVVTVASMLSVMLIIVLGNALVVITVYCDSKLRSQRQNWLIVSLAVADLLVGLLVMPLTLLYEVLGRWTLGTVLCEMWLALDVLFVTASILHICAISLDRYFSVTSPLSYPSKRTPARMLIMIGISWLVSLLICLPPILGWRPENRGDETCTVSTELGYVLYSSLGSFYIPVTILVIVYAKIYSITIQHNRNRLKETERMDKTLKLHAKALPSRELVELELVDETSDPNEYQKNGKKSGIAQVCWHMRKVSSDDSPKSRTVDSPSTAKYSLVDLACQADIIMQNGMTAEKRRRKLKAKERQATLLLGIILSAFILSWLPFFLMYVLEALGLPAPALIFKFFFWLGYCNSGINPVIYTVFNRDFKRGLCRQIRRMSRFMEPLVSLSSVVS